MGLDVDKELNQLKKLWSEASPIAKVTLSLSFFFSLSSLTSLSDHIFKWKGFILDAITFYREWITGPIAQLISYVFNIPLLDSNILDFFLLIGVVIGIYYRGYLHHYHTFKTHDRLLLATLIVAFVSYLTLLGWSFTEYDYSKEASDKYKIWMEESKGAIATPPKEIKQASTFKSVLILTAILLLFISSIYYLIRIEWKTRKFIILNFTIIIGFVLFLGAINAGLTR